MARYNDGFVRDRNVQFAYSSQDPELAGKTHGDEDQELLQEATGGEFGYCESCGGLKKVSQMDILYKSENEKEIVYICVTCKQNKKPTDFDDLVGDEMELS